MNEPNSSTKAEPISPPAPLGGRFSAATRVTASAPEVTSQEPASTGSSNLGDKDITTSPAKLHLSEAPYLARHLKLERDIIKEIGYPQIREIDSYILSLVKERQWVDTEESYQTILKEISKSLGLNEHLDVFARIDKLLLGTRLLSKQRRHEKLARQFKSELEKIKT